MSTVNKNRQSKEPNSFKKPQKQIILSVKESRNTLNQIQASCSIIDREEKKNLYVQIEKFYFGKGWLSIKGNSFRSCMMEEIKTRDITKLYRIKNHIVVVRAYFPNNGIFDISQNAANAIFEIKDKKVRELAIRLALNAVDGNVKKLTAPKIEVWKDRAKIMIEDEKAQKYKHITPDQCDNNIKKVDSEKPNARKKTGDYQQDEPVNLDQLRHHAKKVAVKVNSVIGNLLPNQKTKELFTNHVLNELCKLK